MIDIILVSAGILLLLISLAKNLKLIAMIKDKAIKYEWFFLFMLIVFFFIGYSFYLYTLLFHKIVLEMTLTLVSAIFCFGALFVIFVVIITKRLVENLNADNQDLSSKNMELINLAKDLESNNRELEIAKKSLADKNYELDKTLEEFYTMRMSMQGEKDKKKIKKENISIKNKLNGIKRH